MAMDSTDPEFQVLVSIFWVGSGVQARPPQPILLSYRPRPCVGLLLDPGFLGSGGSIRSPSAKLSRPRLPAADSLFQKRFSTPLVRAS